MAEIIKPVPIDLGDGHSHLLKYTGAGIVKIEDANDGTSIFVLVGQSTGKRVSVKYLASMIWGGLVWIEPQLELLAVQDLVFRRLCDTGFEFMPLLSAIGTAMVEAGLAKRLPAEEKPDEDPQLRATAESLPPASGNGTERLNQD